MEIINSQHGITLADHKPGWAELIEVGITARVSASRAPPAPCWLWWTGLVCDNYVDLAN